MTIKIGIVSKEQNGVSELIKRTAKWHGWVNLDFQNGIIRISNLENTDLEDIIETVSRFFVITTVESQDM